MFPHSLKEHGKVNAIPFCIKSDTVRIARKRITYNPLVLNIISTDSLFDLIIAIKIEIFHVSSMQSSIDNGIVDDIVYDTLVYSIISCLFICRKIAINHIPPYISQSLTDIRRADFFIRVIIFRNLGDIIPDSKRNTIVKRFVHHIKTVIPGNDQFPTFGP